MRGAPPPPRPIILERLKSPQPIIYRQKGNLLESPNNLKDRENILISRFYEHFSRNSRNLGHFWKFEKFQTLTTYHISISMKHVIWRFQIYNLFREIFKFREDKAIMYFAKFLNAFVKPRNLVFFAKQILYLESPDHPLQNDI